MADVWQCRPPLGTPIDWSNPLARGLLAFIDASGNRVSGAPLSLMGAAVARQDGTIYSPGGRGDGAFAACPGLTAISTDFTLVSFCAISSLSNDSYLLGVPYRAGSWSEPYNAVVMARYGSTSNFIAAWSSGTRTVVYPPSQPIFAADGVMSCRAFGKDPSGVIWYKDRQSWDAFSYLLGSSLTGSPNFAAQQPVMIGNNSDTVPGGATGGVYGPQLLYSRRLSANELRSLQDNPWQVFTPRRIWYHPVMIASPGTVLCAFSARSPEASPSAIAETALADIVVAARNAKPYWCAELNAWADFPSEWSDEETAWQPVSEMAAATAAEVNAVAQTVSGISSTAAILTPASMALSTLSAVYVASIDAIVSAAGLTSQAIDTSTVNDAVAQAAASILESAALTIEALVSAQAGANPASITSTAYTPTVSTSAETIAAVTAAALMLSAKTPETMSSSTAAVTTAYFSASLKEAASNALNRIETAALTLSSSMPTPSASTDCVTTVLIAELQAMLGAHVILPLAIVTPDAASASLLANAISSLSTSTASTFAAVLTLVEQTITAGTGVKEVVHLGSPIYTTARRESYFNTSFAAGSAFASSARLRSYIETEQT